MNQAALRRAHTLTQIAEAVWNPTDPVACEASCALNHCAMVIREDSLVERVFGLIARVLP